MCLPMTSLALCFKSCCLTSNIMCMLAYCHPWLFGYFFLGKRNSKTSNHFIPSFFWLLPLLVKCCCFLCLRARPVWGSVVSVYQTFLCLSLRCFSHSAKCFDEIVLYNMSGLSFQCCMSNASTKHTISEP